MQQTNVKRLMLDVRIWLSQGAAAIRQQINLPLQVTTKSGPNDLVTNLDKSNEQFLVAQIRKAYPDAHIVGEEGFGDQVTDLKGLVFFVDPIDGTLNFVKQHNDFATMIGVYEDGQPLVGAIYDVMADQMYWGGPELGVFENMHQLSRPADLHLKDGLFGMNGPMLAANGYQMAAVLKHSSGARIIGSAGIEFTRLITGREVGYVSQLAPWDFAAGRVLAETLGLKVGQIDGQPVDMLAKQPVMVATPTVFQEVLDLQTHTAD
ncbi:inositol monophosphatase family protein [Lactobacillus selangorensis]|uniref:Inositol monophosphatase family protein n=1 Tax=Lactobacillus selangorensis TaxID=81857 RepID=A0A0R2G0K7_9LACO|nr:inositol monophosphatase family protein [Lactobacillus selangorensis]KRN29391.1 inositol monophosphatase family protein [Lactobacillus selangorensis]KRN34080.1 inositol monophosphatase family protein [Lactobacillus selangorensis]